MSVPRSRNLVADHLPTSENAVLRVIDYRPRLIVAVDSIGDIRLRENVVAPAGTPIDLTGSASFNGERA